MQELIHKLDSADSQIQLNNQHQITNLEKQRVRNKVRQDEMNALQKDFEDNV